MKKINMLIIIVSVFFIGYINNVKAENLVDENTKVFYTSHVQSYGWLENVGDGKKSGTTGESKRMEAIKISLVSNLDGGIEYTTYNQNYGWENDYKSNGTLSGTTGESKRMEAIKIKLNGNISGQYDVYYRVHVQDYGWLGWAKNGETAGTIGRSLRIEAIEIKLVDKDTGEITGNSNVPADNPLVYQTHVQNHGWMGFVNENEISGTTGESKRVEAVQIKMKNIEYPGDIKIMSYIAGIGWEQEYKNSGEISGTIKQEKQLEAIKIQLTGELSEYYDVYYSVHVQNFGWLGWAKNGEIAGTLYHDMRIESLKIKLVKKGEGEETGSSYVEKNAYLTYQAHVQDYGTMESVDEGNIAGTTHQGKRMEAITISKNSQLDGDILYQSYIEGTGWESDWKATGIQSGTMKQSKAMQLIRIKLSGVLEEKYDVYYRVHSEKYGWLGWAKNGEDAGASYYDIQAIQVKLYLKLNSNKNSLDTNNHYIETGFYQENGYTYYKDKYGVNATDWVTIMNTKYFFNSLGVMIGENVKKVIDVSEYQGTIDWDKVVNSGNIDGVILRISYSGLTREDAQLSRNISELKRLGIPYGIYIYSYAENYNEGQQYANYTVNILKKYNMKPTIGIFLDLENNNVTNYMGLTEYTNVVNGFMNVMNSNGYGLSTKIYTYKSMTETKLNSETIKNQITWIAQYNHFCTYSGTYVGWQYSDNESIPGINGSVDASVWFTSF